MNDAAETSSSEDAGFPAPPPEAPATEDGWTRWFTWGAPLAFLCVLLTALDTPLWLDEAWTVEDLLGTPILLPGQSVREAAYEALISFWLLVAGAKIASLRLLMIGFSLATLWALARAARPAHARPALAVLLFTSFSVVVHFAVEINRYAELGLGATLSLWACLELQQRPRLYPCVGLVLAGTGSFYIHNTAAITVLSVTGVALLVQALLAPPSERRARITICLAVPAAQLLLVLPETHSLLQRAELFGEAQDSYLAHVYHGLTPASLLRFLRQVSPGGAALPAAVGAAGVLTMLGLVLDGLRRADRERATLVVFAGGPLLAAALASFAQPMFEARVLIPALPATALLAARALRGRLWAHRGIALALALTAWLGFLLQPWPQNVRPVLLTLSEQARHGDGVIVQPPFAWVVLKGNQRVSPVRLPPLTELNADAPTRMQAARLHFGGYPRRTFVVLSAFRGHARALADELPFRFAKVSSLTTSTGFELLLCEDPLPLPLALERCRAPAAVDESAALAAFREGCVLLHGAQPVAALACFDRARTHMPTGFARNEREERDDRAQLAWAIAWSAHRAGQDERARAALREAEELGTTVPPAVREAILGR